MSKPSDEPLFLPSPKQTAFILGNGPSLKGVDLARLSGHMTVGMNAAYRYWREIDWRPTHYACLDLVVGLSHQQAIRELIEEGRIDAFLLRSNLIEALGESAYTPRVISFDVLAAENPLFEGVTVTTGSGAALWAATLGRKQLVMLGVDGVYKELVKGARRRDGIELEIVEEGDNPNYFFERYQQPGDRYNVPNPRPDLHVNSWREAAQNLARTEAVVLNGNPQSAVRCFPFIDLEKFLTTGAEATAPDEELPQRAIGTAQTPSAKLKAFIAQYAKAGAAIGVIFLIALCAFALIVRPDLETMSVAVIMSGFLGCVLLLGLYMRHAILSHLQNLSNEVSFLRAKIVDVERMSRRKS